MIPGADKITVAPVGRVAAAVGAEAVGDARQQEFQRSLAGLVGKSMPAEVLSRLTDGSYMVRVAGNSARMMLPSNPQPGAELPLTLVSLTPRPTFQLSASPQSAAFPAFVDAHLQPEVELYTPGAGLAKPGASATGALQRAAALPGQAGPANQLAAPEPASSQATLSATARVISSVLGAAARSEHPQTAIVAALPLLAAAPNDPAKLASQLKDAIGASGLFYESHVAEWSVGQRPLADLRREPQMQRALPAAANGPEPAPLTAVPGNALAAAAADPATAQFINLQLASQEQGRVAWQGQLLPGQQMAWEISRDPPDRSERPGAGAESLAPPWRSTLRLRFAALGDIGATVVLAGDQLHIALEAGSSGIGGVLRARAGELQRALEASGNPAATLTVTSTATSGEPGHD
jgi:hypothetical protein